MRAQAMQRSLVRVSAFPKQRFIMQRSTQTAAEQVGESKSADVAPKQKGIVVFGGNGYVGRAVMKEALSRNVNVVTINRSGGDPKSFMVPASYQGKVEWVKGDIMAEGPWTDHLEGADGAISCVGGFGNNETMERINGDANINAIQEAKRAGIPRFVYVSAVENNLPDFFLRGYFHGKRRTEEALLAAYPEHRVVLRPGFLHGDRKVTLPMSSSHRQINLPLWVLGKPLQGLFSLPPVQYLREAVPGMKAVLAPPIAVEDLAKAAVTAALGQLPLPQVLDVEDILRAAHDAQIKA